MGWKRAERLACKYRRRLRCEWCNRLTVVNTATWRALSTNQFGKPLPPEQILENQRAEVFECKRERCLVRARPY